MSSLPVEVLLGIYLGLLAGIVPAFVAGSLGFVVRYFTGVTLPGFGVVVLALAIASVNGGLLALADPTILRAPRLLVATLVVLMLALYAHNAGDRLGAELPRRVSFSSIRKRTLSTDVVEFVGEFGRVTVRPTGAIRDVQGYPPLSPDLRTTIAEDSWHLPADLPLSELETRLEDRLRTEYDLADVAVEIDERGRATIAAAPPSSGLSRRVPDRHRAVSVDALVPTGLARGDSVVVTAGEETVSGTVLSARTGADDEFARGDADESTTDDGPLESPPASGARPGGTATAGGEGRVTVAVARHRAAALLAADRARVTVLSRATSPEFDALSLLRRAGYAVRRISVRSETPVDGSSWATDDVATLAVRRRGSEVNGRRRGWVFAPGIERPLEPGDEAFVAGRESAFDRLEEGSR